MLGGVPGVAPAESPLSGRHCGVNAAKIAAGMGARVTILDTDRDCVIWTIYFKGELTWLQSIQYCFAVERTDLLIGAVLIPVRKLQDSARKKW